MKPFVDANIIITAFTQSQNTHLCRRILREFFVTDTLGLLESFHAIKAVPNMLCSVLILYTVVMH